MYFFFRSKLNILSAHFNHFLFVCSRSGNILFPVLVTDPRDLSRLQKWQCLNLELAANLPVLKFVWDLNDWKVIPFEQLDKTRIWSITSWSSAMPSPTEIVRSKLSLTSLALDRSTGVRLRKWKVGCGPYRLIFLFINFSLSLLVCVAAFWTSRYILYKQNQVWIHKTESTKVNKWT